MKVDVFLSYAREDRTKAERLVHRLESRELSVWWDPDVAPGKDWPESIEQALNSATCVVVLWSQISVKARFVREEAESAKNRGVLLPVLIDTVEIENLPLGYRTIESADLSRWRGDPYDHEYSLLCDRISSILSGEEVSSARDEARRARRRRQSVRSLAALLLIVAVGVLLYTEPWVSSAPPTISDFAVESTSIPWNSSTALVWKSDDADRVELTANGSVVGELDPEGRHPVSPGETTTYRIRAMRGNVRGTDVSELIVRVGSPDLSGTWKSSEGGYYVVTSTRSGYRWEAYTIENGKAMFHNYGAYATATVEYMSSAVPSVESRATFAAIPPKMLHPPTISWSHGEKFTKVQEGVAYIAHSPLTVYGKWVNEQGRQFSIDQVPEGFSWSVPVHFESGDVTADGGRLSVQTTPASEFGSWISAGTLTGTTIGDSGSVQPTQIAWNNGVTFQAVDSIPFQLHGN